MNRAAMTPIRIVYIITSLGIGGAERQLLLLLKHLDRARFTPHLIAFFSGDLEPQFRALGVPVEVIHCRQVRLAALLQCWHRVRQPRTGLLHAQGSPPGNPKLISDL